MAQRLDIVLFGATGFTGNFVARTIAKLSRLQNRQITWGIAGRSEEKLRQLLTECEQRIGVSLSNIPIIFADINQESSLKKMARSARLIVNCCGPFSYFGEPVVKACIEEGTHHIDVSAEVPYMEEIQLKYHQQAQEKGIYIISACAYESIPVDLGITWLEKKFDGTLNSVEAYLDYWEEGDSVSGTAFNYSTWESMLYVFQHGNKLKEIRQKLFPHRLPQLQPELKQKVVPHKSDITKKWVFLVDATDRPVVQRTQRYFFERNSKRPVQIETYFCMKSFMQLFWVLLFTSIIFVLSQFSFGRKLLKKYPEKFSGGMISRQTPSEERTEKVRFSTTLYGEGWKEKLQDGNHEFSTLPNRSITVKVSGKNPGYGATAVILVSAAITVITENDKMPKTGGVYPPGYAFAGTSLVQELNRNEVIFEVLEEKNLNI